jgi:hypothetical protein
MHRSHVSAFYRYRAVRGDTEATEQWEELPVQVVRLESVFGIEPPHRMGNRLPSRSGNRGPPMRPSSRPASDSAEEPLLARSDLRVVRVLTGEDPGHPGDGPEQADDEGSRQAFQPRRCQRSGKAAEEPHREERTSGEMSESQHRSDHQLLGSAQMHAGRSIALQEVHGDPFRQPGFG